MIKVPASSTSFDKINVSNIPDMLIIIIIVNQIVEGEFILDIKHKTSIIFAPSVAIRHWKRNFLCARGLVINFTLDTSFCMTVDSVSTKSLHVSTVENLLKAYSFIH